jgi:hypothetical protein
MGTAGRAMTIDQTDKIERMATLVAQTRKEIAMRSTYQPTDRKTAMQDAMLGPVRQQHWALVILIVLVALMLTIALALILAPSPVAPSAPVPYPNISQFFAHPAPLPAPSVKP